MNLIVGLGNPGNQYKNNRHNTGFIILDAFAAAQGASWQGSKKTLAETAVLQEIGVTLAKPQTYMNKSGEAVKKLLDYLGISIENVLVIHDDVDLEPMQFKSATDSSSAGHKGVQDIIDKLGTQRFNRLRVGVGRPGFVAGMLGKTIEKYVLEDFPNDQLENVKKLGIEHLLSSLSV